MHDSRSRAAALLLMALTFPVSTSFAQEKTPAPRPAFKAMRVASPPAIDGDLGDAAWANVPEVTSFTQHDPDDGKAATRPTSVKIVYDDDAIYFGAYMHDTKPVTTLLSRRDTSTDSDSFRIMIDSQHDRLSGAAFWVNPSNVQIDMTLYNDIYDDWSWDAVWQSATKIVPDGWIAEVRIPYSQLRFTNAELQTWGINFARRIVSNAEVDYVVNTPKGENGRVSRFADLTNIDGIKPKRMFELMPYGVARGDFASRVDTANPFAQSSSQRIDGGMDVKYGITSNLTLTGTINPDFGQVEVDPAVLNLSQFETFFSEKRPFFTEGAQMFRYGQGPANSRWGFNFGTPTFFYSRRIGRQPQGNASSAEFADIPGETTILGAAKITGKFGKGWSVGVLDAVTDKETGTFHDTFAGAPGGRRFSQQVEPMTNYLVARTAKEYGKASRVGMLFTSVNRRLANELETLRENAYFGGVDGHTLFKEKSWLFEWHAGASLVQGSEAAIAATQRSSARYYQRPDSDLDYDPTRNSLAGYGGRAMLGKQTGKYRLNLSAQSFSPGFEVNDVGFMSRTDMTATHAVIQYVNEESGKRIRERGWWFGKFQNWNYDGDLVGNGFHSSGFVELKNYWWAASWLGGSVARLDDRKTRGGPLVEAPENFVVGVEGGSDTRKKVSFNASYELYEAADRSFSRWSRVSLTYRPTPALRVSLSPSLSRQRTFAQYVSTVADPSYTPTFGARYVFGTLNQKTLDVGIRTEWTASSRLSLQLYVQPFIASGDYYDFKHLVRPRTDEYAPHTGDVGNRDFNLRSVKGNAVVRWEFRPGSALYVVWNENRSEVAPVGDFRYGRDLSAIADAPSTDVILVKVSYWLPM